MQATTRRWLTLVAVFVLGALCGLSIPPMIFSRSLKAQHARHMKITADIHALGRELEEFRSANGAYPSTERGLHSLAAMPKDPWGNDYVYVYPGKMNRDEYDLFSPGPDRKPYTLDDDWGEPDLTSR
jgi:general secretion pathway protein G